MISLETIDAILVLKLNSIFQMFWAKLWSEQVPQASSLVSIWRPPPANAKVDTQLLWRR